jgi:hypothetical protein
VFSIYPDVPNNEKISGIILRENEYGTQEIRKKELGEAMCRLLSELNSPLGFSTQFIP